ncbi:hypothetical protein McaMca56_003483 [Microsporum canis]
MRLLAKTECDHGRAGGRPRKEVSIQRLSTPDKNGLGVKDLGLDGPYGLPFYLENYGTVIRCTPGDGIFAQLRALAEAYKSSRARTKRIKLVLLTNEFNEQLRKWIQSILDDEDLHTSVRLQGGKARKSQEYADREC